MLHSMRRVRITAYRMERDAQICGPTRRPSATVTDPPLVHMIQFVSTFGNASVLLLLSLLLTAWLARESGARAALAWLCALALCVGVIAVLKIYFHGCPRPALGLRSPSGHAGFSLFVYGAITICAARDPATWRQLALPLLGCVWIAAIAWSRYALHAHSIAEIVFGLLIGASALLLFVGRAGPLPIGRFPFVVSVVIAAVFVAVMLNLRLNVSFESWLGGLGRHWRPWLPLCTRT